MHIDIAQRRYAVRLDAPLDISIPLRFNGEQPNFFNAPRATAQPFESGSFSGDTRRGGSCNVEMYRLIPHCNGTHTECAGHITHERVSLRNVLQTGFVPATLVTLVPEPARQTSESYEPDLQPQDRVITRRLLQHIWPRLRPGFGIAFILRTHPNDAEKRRRDYSKHPAPFFTLEAMDFLNDRGVEHLLVDFPSIDRAN
ncbi:MAG: hypothetical protein D6814_02455, partial [Calditrichaeota bacterium]